MSMAGKVSPVIECRVSQSNPENWHNWFGGVAELTSDEESEWCNFNECIYVPSVLRNGDKNFCRYYI